MLYPLGEGCGPSFKQTWITTTQACFVPSLFEIAPVVLEKKTKKWKFTDRQRDGQTDRHDRQKVIRKVLQLRWAKNWLTRLTYTQTDRQRQTDRYMYIHQHTLLYTNTREHYWIEFNSMKSWAECFLVRIFLQNRLTYNPLLNIFIIAHDVLMNLKIFNSFKLTLLHTPHYMYQHLYLLYIYKLPYIKFTMSLRILLFASAIF